MVKVKEWTQVTFAKSITDDQVKLVTYFVKTFLALGLEVQLNFQDNWVGKFDQAQHG